MENNEKKYWFPAKKYGWGWGWPCSWQGWLVFLVYITLAIAGGILLANKLGLFIAYMACLAGAIIAICWLKGEKPRWRWGND